LSKRQRQKESGRKEGRLASIVGGDTVTICVGLFFLFLPVQEVVHHRKIDAHQVEVTGTISWVSRGRLTDSYYATYTYGGREVESDSFTTERYLTESDTVCLEIDSTSPERARPCGERYSFRTFCNITFGSLLLLSGAWTHVKGPKRRKSRGTITGWRVRRTKAPVPTADDAADDAETVAETASPTRNPG